MKGLAIIGVIYLVILSFIVDGFVLSVLWRWFISSLFNLPLLTIPYAIGISTIIGYLRPYKKTKTDKDDFQELLIAAIVRPLLFLLLGYIIHLFI